MIDWGDVIKFVVVILIVVIPVLSQIIAKIKEQQQAPPPPPGRAPRPQRPPQEDFKREIEDFLRRAAEGRDVKRGGQRPAPAAARRKPAAPPPVPAAERPAEPPPAAETTVVQHVKKYMDSGEFDLRTQKLGDEVALADDKIDARVREVFKQQISEFDWRTQSEIEEAGEQVPTSASAASAAAGLALMLANPENLRQAIVLNEILQPPAHRWA